MNPITATDLFCGAGGTSTGILRACAELGRSVRLLAINHWDTAIDTHTRNHPGVRHLCQSLDSIDPRKESIGPLDLLTASPECTHHSNARGGKPMSDQSRASAWHVVRWAETKQPRFILIENVREFRNWGPLNADGKPSKSGKGKTYQAFLTALRSLGYFVEDRLLNAADYGDPTTRVRLFIMARRGRKPTWPRPSHVMRWKSARGIIDWEHKGKSIFERKKPLSRNTLRRIEAGLRKFGGDSFLIHITHAGGEDRCSSLDNPLPTVTTAKRGEMSLIEPFLVQLRGTTQAHIGSSAKSIDGPCPTLTASGSHVALCEPFLIGQQSCAAPRAVSEPVPTICASGAVALVEPFLVKYYGTGLATSVDEPVDTITAKDRFGLVEPRESGRRLDILFRMLQPRELARAMSFPDDYQFAGTREAKVKQIGNAVPVETAKALCMEMLR